MKIQLQRRGFELGSIDSRNFGLPVPASRWRQGKAVYLPSVCRSALKDHLEDIKQSAQLYTAILAGREADSLLSRPPYRKRLAEMFECLGGSINEGDQQEVETLSFDAVQAGAVIAEDLWLKISWLSYFEKDTSLRFRFSFGSDFAEDVAADPQRQMYAASLCDAVFAESAVITNNLALHRLIQDVLACQSLSFVERIVYFNGPQGGAYLHHDLERGHAGVVYAQLSGKTFWIAIPARLLQEEVAAFIQECEAKSVWPDSLDQPMCSELLELAQHSQQLLAELQSFSHTGLIHLINETAEFVQRLVDHGFGQLLLPGDALLLPQADEELCCWHSVFCLDEHAGQALSFAIRAD